MSDPFQTTFSDRLTFAREWVRAPLKVAAAGPSGEALARLITQEISPSSSPVIELGPGSGVFTRALLRKGVPERRIALVERGDLFLDELKRAFPKAHIHAIDASNLRHRRIFSDEQAGAVVSGLPFLSMPTIKVYSILLGAFRNLRHDASLYQFTYGRRCPVSPVILARLGLVTQRLGWTVRNLPPASVYKISRSSYGAYSAHIKTFEQS